MQCVHEMPASRALCTRRMSESDVQDAPHRTLADHLRIMAACMTIYCTHHSWKGSRALWQPKALKKAHAQQHSHLGGSCPHSARLTETQKAHIRGTAHLTDTVARSPRHNACK
eukprot:scaffold19025_cov20-Tisochrysis_lutea.AAC.2